MKRKARKGGEKRRTNLISASNPGKLSARLAPTPSSKQLSPAFCGKELYVIRRRRMRKGVAMIKASVLGVRGPRRSLFVGVCHLVLGRQNI